MATYLSRRLRMMAAEPNRCAAETGILDAAAAEIDALCHEKREQAERYETRVMRLAAENARLRFEADTLLRTFQRLGEEVAT